MPLLAPSIGLVSECSSQIRVRGQIPGTIVDIYIETPGESPRRIGGDTATWPEQDFPVKEALPPGSVITAVQRFADGESSVREECLGVLVQPAPAALGDLSCRSHIYECGQALWIEGAVPGARVVLRELRSGRELAEADAPEGVARLFLPEPIAASDRLEVQQRACDRTGPWIALPRPEPPASRQGRLWTQARFVEPLYECDVAGTVTGIMEGSLFHVLRNDAEAGTAWADLTSHLVRMDSPLRRDEQLSAWYEFPGCGLTQPMPPYPISRVRPLAEMPAPSIAAPLCANSRQVRVFGLRPGLRLQFRVDGTEIGDAAAASEVQDFTLPALPNGLLTVRQLACNRWGPDSAPVEIRSSLKVREAPMVAAPVYECATRVRLTGLTPGSTVRVVSERLGQISRFLVATQRETDVDVSPALIAGDRIAVEQMTCGGMAMMGVQTLVERIQSLPAPTIDQPLYGGLANGCVVRGVVPGATVELYVDDEYRNARVATTAVTAIPSSLAGSTGFDRFVTGNRLRARQRFCHQVSPFGMEVRVEPLPLPQAPVLISPVAGATGVSRSSPTFYWRDPGARGPAAADFYSLVVFDAAGTLVRSEQSIDTTYVLSALFTPGTRFQWAVRATRFIYDYPFGGARSYVDGPLSEIFTFETERPPMPPPPPPPPPPVRMAPDLGFSFPPTPIEAFPYASQPFNITWVTANFGNAPAAAHRDRIVIGEVGIGPYMFEENIDVPRLDVGELFTITVPFPEGLPTGNYTLDVFLNVDNGASDEIERRNNVSFGNFIVL